MESLQQKIIDEYESDLAQEVYLKAAKTGLWGGEKILIDRYFKKGSTILDVGCGTGRTTLPLHDRGFQITGIDITPRMIENAKRIAAQEQKNIEYRVMDACHLEYPDNAFDAVLFSNCGWNQIPSAGKRTMALNEIFRVLRPGGYYLFSTHIRSWRYHPRYWAAHWARFFILKPLGMKIWENDFGDTIFRRETDGKKFGQEQFINHPSENEVKKTISKCGFNILTMEHNDTLAPTKPMLNNPTMVIGRKPA